MQATDYGWFIIRCEPNRETTGTAGLVAHGLRAYLPQIKVRQKPRRGVVRFVLRPMFVGYLFSWCSPSDPSWRRLYNSPGLRGPLRLGDMTAMVTQEQIDAIARKEAELLNQKPSSGPGFKPHEIVRLKSDSPFAGQLAEIHRLDDEARVTILLSLFGRVTKAVVPTQQIERV